MTESLHKLSGRFGIGDGTAIAMAEKTIPVVIVLLGNMVPFRRDMIINTSILKSAIILK